MSAEIAERRTSFMDIPGCGFTPTGLTLPMGLKYEHWERIGRQLQLADRAVQWWIGDWLVYGEVNYYDRYTQALEETTGRKTQTLMNYAFVAKGVEFSRRREDVDFSTHAEVASLEPDEQDRLLAKAAKETLSRNTVRREVERIKRAKKPQPPVADLVLSKEARQYLDEYIEDLAHIVVLIPEGLPVSEKNAIESMIHEHGTQALWQRKRTRQTDFDAITGLFSFDEGTPGMERASKAHVSAWLNRCGYFMSDADLDERLDVMVDNKILEIMSVEESRQDGRRGIMIDLYALTREFQMQMEKR